MEMRTIEMPLTEAIAASKAMLPHLDSIHEVITSAHIVGDTMTTTDRYTAAQAKLSVSIDGGSILLPRAAVKWISKIKPVRLRSWLSHFASGDFFVVIEAPESGVQREEELSESRRREATVTVTVVGPRGLEQQRKFNASFGIFPGVVYDMIRDSEPAEASSVLISPGQLRKFTKRGGEPVEMTFTRPRSDGHPGPVIVKVGNITGLISQNIKEDK
ncbi:hypothetical protein ACXR2T_10730 [Leucobacter sp. HY1910]